MNQLSKLSNDERPWLRTVHEKKKERSFLLGKKTIDTLVKEGKPVTLHNIHEKSKQLDTQGKGIHTNTVKSNTLLYEYYKKNSTTYKQRQTKKRSKQLNIMNDTHLKRINPKRNLTQVRHKYMKLSKQELVERLIHTEQFIAENHKKWTAQFFQKFFK